MRSFTASYLVGIYRPFHTSHQVKGYDSQIGRLDDSLREIRLSEVDRTSDSAVSDTGGIVPISQRTFAWSALRSAFLVGTQPSTTRARLTLLILSAAAFFENIRV